MAKGTRGRISRGEQGRIAPGGAKSEPPGDASTLSELGVDKHLLLAVRKAYRQQARHNGRYENRTARWLGRDARRTDTGSLAGRACRKPATARKAPGAAVLAARAEKAASERETEPRQAVIPARRGARDEP
jgi:hypothetical protein